MKQERRPGLQEEAGAFDSQIAERVAHGHIPDLRLAEPCDYFYNNSWRRPAYVKLDFGEQFELIANALDRFLQVRGHDLRLLEVGCGPGYMSLELARAGYNVTGMDISRGCIEIARQLAEQDPWKEQRGPLSYFQGDFFSAEELSPSSFHAIVFVGALHHFADQHSVMERAHELLRSDGVIIAHEPTRDRVTFGNAAFVHLLQIVLSAGNGFFRKMPIPATIDEHVRQIEAICSDQKYQTQNGANVQSVHDNDAGHQEMFGALREHFTELDYRERYAFFHEIIGGLRFDEETNTRLARYLRDTDALLCSNGSLQSTEFFFVGAKRDS